MPSWSGVGPSWKMRLKDGFKTHVYLSHRGHFKSVVYRTILHLKYLTSDVYVI